MKVVDLLEMNKLLDSSRKIGLSESMVVENSAINASTIIQKIYNENDFQNEIVFLIGKGKNGADAIATARQLENKGVKTRAFLLFPDELPCDLLKDQVQLAYSYGVKINEMREVEQLTNYFDQFTNKFILVDGILGTGQTLPLSNYLYDINQVVNHHNNLVFSIDMPTGVCAKTGKVISRAIIADYTLAIGLPKTGLYSDSAPRFCGKIKVVDSGLSKVLLEDTGQNELLNPHKIIQNLEERDLFGHKNTFGHCLVIGGTTGLTGALILASKAALKVGAGLVTAVTWESNYQELISRMTPEIMTNTIPDGSARIEILPKLKNYDSIVLGPGIGKTSEARELVIAIMNSFSGTLVIDADAINLLDIERDFEMINNRKGPTVLTPHLKEFSDFAKTTMEEVSSNPYQILSKVVAKLNCAIVLKGACSFLALPDGKILINYFPNDGLATAGSGDVLAGIIGGLLAGSQYDSTTVGIFDNKASLYDGLSVALSVHTLAGKFAALELGARSMGASDIIKYIPYVFNKTKNLDNILEMS